MELGSIACTHPVRRREAGQRAAQGRQRRLPQGGAGLHLGSAAAGAPTIVSEVEPRLAKLVQALPYGDPARPEHRGRPADQREGGDPRRELGRGGGRERRAGASRAARAKGAVVPPVLLAAIDDSMKVGCQEVFGPVVCIVPFDTLDQAIARVNATPYGLADRHLHQPPRRRLRRRAQARGRRRARQRDLELARRPDALRRLEGQRLRARGPALCCARDDRRAHRHFHSELAGERIMAKMKGGELIAEYLVKQKVPYLFGICGHGNVGILDPLYAVRDKLKLDLAAPRAVRRPHGRRLLPREAPAGGDAHLDRPGLGEPRDVARHRAVGLVGVPGDHVQRADLADEPRAVPGDLQAQPGGLPLGDAPGGEARVPAHARRHAAARAAPGLRHHGHRPARAGEHRRARTTSTRKKTTSRCRRHRTSFGQHRPGASEAESRKR